MKDTTITRLLVALLFAISFALIGWTAPILYASHAPSENFIEVHNFSAEDTTVDSNNHYICFDRTVHRPSTGMTYTELYLVNGDTDERVEMGSEGMDRYYQGGHHKVITPLNLPQNLEPGTYRYLIVIELQLAENRVDRLFVYESDTFNVSEGVHTTYSNPYSNFTC